MPLIGGVILAMTFTDKCTLERKTILARFKILAKGKTDWVPIILGGMAIDCESRGGLGIQPMRRSFYIARLGIHVSRSETYERGRAETSINKKLEEAVYANRSEVVTTEFDSDYASDSGSDTDYVDLALAEERRALREGRKPAPSAVSRPAVKRQAKDYDDDLLDELILDTAGLTLPAGGGVWVPVRRRRVSGRGED